MPILSIRTPRRALGVLGAAVILTQPRPLLAQPTPQEKALAEGLFQEARKEKAAGKIAEACVKFAESYRLVAGLGTLLNLADCHEKEGKTASAWAEFVEALAIARRTNQPERVRFAEEHAQALEKRLSRIRIVLADAPENLVVRLDGRPLTRGVLGAPVPVDPGEHTVEVSAPGKKTWSGSVKVQAEARNEVVQVPLLEADVMGPKATSPPGTGPAPEPPRVVEPGSPSWWSGRRTASIALLGLGAVGVGVGSYFGIKTFDYAAATAGHCDATGCDSTGAGLAHEGHVTGAASTVAFVAAGVLSATGVVLLVTARTPTTPGPTATRVSVEAIRGGGGALWLRGAW